MALARWTSSLRILPAVFNGFPRSVRRSYGEIWLAQNTFGTLRAVKIVRRETFWNSRPFEREFKGIQKFEPLSRAHEGLVDIFQVGRTDNYFYYVMELTDNASVAADISRRPPHSEIPNLKSQIPNLKSEIAYIPRTLQHDLRTHGRLPVFQMHRN